MSKDNSEKSEALIFGKQIDKSIVESNPSIQDDIKLKSVASRIDDLGKRISKINTLGGPFDQSGLLGQEKSSAQVVTETSLGNKTVDGAVGRAESIQSHGADEALQSNAESKQKLTKKDPDPEEEVLDEFDVDDILNAMSENDIFDEDTPPYRSEKEPQKAESVKTLDVAAQEAVTFDSLDSPLETKEDFYDPLGEDDEDQDKTVESSEADAGLSDGPVSSENTQSVFADMLGVSSQTSERDDELLPAEEKSVEKVTGHVFSNYLNENDSDLFYTEDDLMPIHNRDDDDWGYDADQDDLDVSDDVSTNEGSYETPTLKMYSDEGLDVPGTDYKGETGTASEIFDDGESEDELYYGDIEDDADTVMNSSRKADQEDETSANTFDVSDFDKLYPDDEDIGMDDDSDIEEDLDNLMLNKDDDHEKDDKSLFSYNEIDDNVDDEASAESSKLFAFLGGEKTSNEDKNPVFVLKNPIPAEESHKDEDNDNFEAPEYLDIEKPSKKRFVIPVAATAIALVALVAVAYQGILPGVNTADLPYANQLKAAGLANFDVPPEAEPASTDLASVSDVNSGNMDPVQDRILVSEKTDAMSIPDMGEMASASDVNSGDINPVQGRIFVTEIPDMGEGDRASLEPEATENPRDVATSGPLPDATMEPPVSDLNEMPADDFSDLDVIDQLAREIDGFDIPEPVDVDDVVRQSTQAENAIQIERIDQLEQKVDDALTQFETSFSNIEKELSRMNGLMISTMERNSTLEQGILDTQRSVRAIGAIAAEFTALQESLDQTQVVLLDIASRVSAIESKNPAIAEDVDKTISDLTADIERLSASMAIIARMAVNGSAKMVPESEEAPSQSQATAMGSAAAASQPKPRVPPLTQNPIVFETMDGAGDMIDTSEIKIDANVRKGDFVEQYGYVLDVVPATGNQVLVIMENGSVLVSR